jgi:hypothetical protein
MSLGSGMIAKTLLVFLEKYSDEFRVMLEQEYEKEFIAQWYAGNDSLMLLVKTISQGGSVLSENEYKITIEKKPG